VAVSGSEDNTLRVWDLASGRCTAVLEGHTRGVCGVALAANGRSAVSESYDATVRLWDLASGRCLATYAEGSEEAFKVWVMAQHGPVALNIERSNITLRATTDGAVVARFPGSLWAAACSADGRYVVGGANSGAVYLLRLHTRYG
jgi:WD40 repeat protein